MHYRTARTALAACGLLTVLALATFVTPHPRQARAIANCDTGSAGVSAAEQAMVDGINGERAKAGLPPVAISPALSRAAAWKSEDPSAQPAAFSHTDSLGRMPSVRARDCGYVTGAGEIIAWGYSSVGATVAAWMNSPGHRAAILDPRYVVAGPGNSGSAWTVKFGSVDDSGSPLPANTPTKTPTATPTRTATPAPTSATATPTPSPTKTPSSTVPASTTPTPAPTSLPSGGSAGVTLLLSAGVNIITYTGADMPVRGALGPITNVVKGVYEWNQAEQRWEKHLLDGPAYVSTFFLMRHGGVYAIELTNSMVWTY